MRLYATLLFSFALVLAGQQQPERPLSLDQFPSSDPSAVGPLINVTPQTRPAENTGGGLPSQKLGPGDLVSLSVSDCPDLNRSFRVTESGMLKLPLLKEPILAAGKEPQDIEDEVTRALIREEILVQPVVSASVLEYRSVPVSVVGAVKHPVTFQAVGNITLLDALAKAEWLTQDAGTEILVSHPHAAGGTTATAPLSQRISVVGLIADADPTLNIRLVGGEEIRVPPAGKIYIEGKVKKPGVYQGNENSVLTALALSEGVVEPVQRVAYIYRREAGKAGRDEIPVELSKIMHRKAPDVPLEANDILYVPDANGKRLSNQIIEHIIGFGTAAGSGLLIWH